MISLNNNNINFSDSKNYIEKKENESIAEENNTLHFSENNEEINANNFDVKILYDIQKSIQSMSKYNQIQVAKILYTYTSINLNENKYGLFINLTELNDDIINKLIDFIKYINIQENNINEFENYKNEIKNTYF